MSDAQLMRHTARAMDMVFTAMEPRPQYVCGNCDWKGASPSWSDLSAVDEAGRPKYTHIPVCPVCLKTQITKG